jgi:hypothetical protein
VVAPASACMSHLRLAVALAFTSSLGACEAWHLSINSDGLVFVSIVSDGQPRDRFRIRTRHSHGAVRVSDVPESGQVTFSGLADGVLELTLLPPGHCQIRSPNPQTVTVASGRELRLTFDATCD